MQSYAHLCQMCFVCCPWVAWGGPGRKHTPSDDPPMTLSARHAGPYGQNAMTGTVFVKDRDMLLFKRKLEPLETFVGADAYYDA